MSWALPVSLPICRTSPPRRYVYVSDREKARLTHGQVVTGFKPENDGLKQAFTGADIVVIPAGIPRE